MEVLLIGIVVGVILDRLCMRISRDFDGMTEEEKKDMQAW
jgi:uncharacterized membrane-anchored protein YhcB (DUF1043 family)